MAYTDYDIWAVRVNEAIRSRDAVENSQAPVGTPKEVILEFAAEAAAIAGAMGRNIEAVEILGTDRFDTLVGFLDEMSRFEEFSFLEYRYKLPCQRQPGLRFKVETGGPAIVVHYFKDLVFWDVDQDGKRIHHEPIQFDLSGGKIRAIPNPALAELFAGCTTWQLALRETITLPFRHLFDPKDYSLPPIADASSGT